MTPREEQLAFYHAIGMSVTQWAHVERRLAALYTNCFNDKESELNTLAFFSVENFRSKLQMLDRVLCSRYRNSEHLKDWHKLADKSQKLSKLRNKLAHYWELNIGGETAGKRVALLPFIQKIPEDPKKFPSNLSGALYVQEIYGYGLKFAAHSSALINFRQRLAGQAELIPKSFEQPNNPPTIQYLVHQIHVYTSPPPESTQE